MKRILMLTPWLMTLCLMACAPDVVPPMLVSSSPSEGAVNVFFGEDLRLQFNENILPSSVNASTLTLTATSGASSQPVPHSVRIEGGVVHVRVATIPSIPTNYALVADGLSDQSGNRAPLTTVNFSSQPWLPVGGKLNTNPAQSPPSLGFWTNTPVAAWLETNSQLAKNIVVKRWDGTAWQALGGSLNLNLARDASPPVLVAQNNQNPVVAFTQSNGSKQQLYVKRWDGSTWQTLQAAGFDPSLNLQATSDSADPSLALDNTGRPVVAFAERNNTDFTVYVKRWTGSTWEQLGGIYLDVVPSANAITPSIAIGTDNQPVVAWSENQSLMVKRFDGTNWQRLEGANINLYRAYHPSMAIDSSNTPFLVWSEDITSAPTLDNTNIVVRRWDGANWVSVGGKLNTFSAGVEPSLLVAGDVPTVLFREYDNARNRVQVQRFNGTAWVSFPSLEYTRFVGVTRQSSGNTNLPILAFLDALNLTIGVVRINEVRP
jgi:hypothetical protein